MGRWLYPQWSDQIWRVRLTQPTHDQFFHQFIDVNKLTSMTLIVYGGHWRQFNWNNLIETINWRIKPPLIFIEGLSIKLTVCGQSVNELINDSVSLWFEVPSRPRTIPRSKMLSSRKFQWEWKIDIGTLIVCGYVDSSSNLLQSIEVN